MDPSAAVTESRLWDLLVACLSEVFEAVSVPVSTPRDASVRCLPSPEASMQVARVDELMGPSLGPLGCTLTYEEGLVPKVMKQPIVTGPDGTRWSYSCLGTNPGQMTWRLRERT